MRVVVGKLWRDDSGAIISAELVLILTILAIGAIAGLTSLRDAVLEELADAGQAIGNINQSFNIGGVTSFSSATGGTIFTDQLDVGDAANATGPNSRCLVIAPAGPVSPTEVAAGT